MAASESEDELEDSMALSERLAGRSIEDCLRALRASVEFSKLSLYLVLAEKLDCPPTDDCWFAMVESFGT